MINLAYQGYLVKIGDWEIPKSWIKAETYSVLRSGQDLDSYRDADGKLHRTALEHFLTKVEFETPPLKTNIEVAKFMKNIQDRYINATEKKVEATVYIAETDSYETHEMYVPDITFPIYYADDEKIQYNSFRVALIEY